ncbi:MAG: helix-turn-helix transcriptional regulator [Ignavibacteriales bacterium]|nr:MAG: helix-turn-helix transcriptional regulator [Ignavibacteriales bacterium]
MSTKLIVKNMVCNRCIKVIADELYKMNIPVKDISLGEVVIDKEIDLEGLSAIKKMLEENGFELIEDRRATMIEKIKIEAIKFIHRDDEAIKKYKRFSDYISETLNYDYHYLSNLFSSIENITIEQYLINQKIERAKELLKYGELTLSEIAYKLDYSSVAHLSGQFKKVTGLTASQFKSLTENSRKPLDKI